MKSDERVVAILGSIMGMVALAYAVVVTIIIILTMILNSFIDFFTPLGVSIIGSLVVLLGSYKSLIMQTSLLLSFFTKNKSAVAKVALAIVVAITAFSAYVKFTNIEKIEMPIVKFRAMSEEFVHKK